MVFKIPTLPFILNKWTRLIENLNWIWSFFGSIFSYRAGAGAFQLQFFLAELELELLGSIFSAQSWSWSLKALGVKLEPAPNQSQLSISDPNLLRNLSAWVWTFSREGGWLSKFQTFWGTFIPLVWTFSKIYWGGWLKSKHVEEL